MKVPKPAMEKAAKFASEQLLGHVGFRFEQHLIAENEEDNEESGLDSSFSSVKSDSSVSSVESGNWEWRWPPGDDISKSHMPYLNTAL